MKTKNRSGLTLVEILIALTMTLIVLGAMVQAFQFASGEIAQGRSVLELANRLRNVEQLLRRDLAGLTVEVRPHVDNEPKGYFEFVEGDLDDRDSLLTGATTDDYLGDLDDILAFTSRSLEGQFKGRFGGSVHQATYAEIIWYTEINDQNSNGSLDFIESASLNRRVLLIAPHLNGIAAGTAFDLPFSTGEDNGNPDPASNPGLRSAMEFFIENDISARWVDSNGNGNRDLIVANSLADLARREFRFSRDSTGPFPFEFVLSGLSSNKMGVANFSAGNFNVTRSGDEVLLTNLAAFDVQIYSPNALVGLSNNIAVNQSDVGSNIAGLATSNIGGFVDLALGNGVGGMAFGLNDLSLPGNPPIPQFSTAPINQPNPWTFATYCTWTPTYEADEIDQDGDGVADEGRNGIDDIVPIANSNGNGVDDDGEAETAPPYPFVARGIKTTFRVIEKNTKQVRQTSVIHNFSKQ